MRKLSLFLLLLTVLISCRSQNAGIYFNRPELNECITMNRVGFMACNGVVKPIPPKMVVPETPEDYFKAKEYYLDREIGHYVCLVHPNRCTQ